MTDSNSNCKSEPTTNSFPTTGSASITPSPSPQSDKQTYLFGSPITHSISPLLHDTLYTLSSLPWRYTLFDSLSIPSFLSLLRDPKCAGAAVTMPHKISIIPHLDELTSEAREVGAVNTVVVKQGNGGRRRCIGANTDVVGIREALGRSENGVFERALHKPALVLGSGGAARSAIYALHTYFHSTPIYIVNRDAGEVDAIVSSFNSPSTTTASPNARPTIIHLRTPSQARCLPGPILAVGCVPDFPPRTVEEKQAREVLEVMLTEKKEKGVILEMAYHPRVWTAVGRAAREAGWRVVLGVEAVIWQGVEQHRLWTGRELGQGEVRKVVGVVRRAVREAEETEREKPRDRSRL